MASKAIVSLTFRTAIDTGGWSQGLKLGSKSIDQFYDKAAAKLKTWPILKQINQFQSLGGVAAGALRSIVRPLDGVAAGLGKITKAAGSVVSTVAKVGEGLAGLGLAVAVGVAAFASGGLDRIDKLTDTAARLGTTTKSLSELRYAANLTGSSAEDLDAALEKLSANLGDSAMQATPASLALTRLGLDAKALATQDPSVAFRKIVDGFGQVPDAATRASLAMDIFGKGGVKILNTLGAGGEELDRLAAEARKFGVSIADVDAAKVGAAKDALDRAGASIEGVGNTLAIKLAPFIEVAANKFADLVATAMDGGSTIEKAMDFAATGVARLIDGGKRFAVVFLKAIAEVATAAGRLAGFLGQDNKGILSTADQIRSAASTLEKTDPAKAFSTAYDALKSNATSAAASVAKLAETNRSAVSGYEALAGSISTVSAKLKEQIDTFGKSSGEIEVYKLEQAGATAEQLASIKADAAKLKALEAGKKAQEEIADFAKGLKEKIASPMEKAREEVGKLQKAFDAGLIDRATFDRGKGHALKEAGGGEPKFAGALELGSKEAYSAILAATTGRGNPNLELERIGRGQLAAANAAVAGIDTLNRNLAANAGKVIGF